MSGVLDDRAALVVFSGGQDSTTCLGWALEKFERVATVGFDYEQRHRIELECRLEVLRRIKEVKSSWASRLSDDTTLNLKLLKDIGGTAMIERVEIQMGTNGLPNTFVPGRNLLFLVAAAACAYRQGIRHIITGVCETDYSGYPDCRDDTIKALQVAINLGTDARFIIETPLMWIGKADTWRLAAELGGKEFVDLVREYTHTCYEGDRSHRNDWGYGCGTCPACILRKTGYEEYEKRPAL